MSKQKLKANVNNKILGNYTKGAIKSFEENIVTKTDYLETSKVIKGKENGIE
ncbi:hypothetical protein [Clostridium tarantellae]|uniref:hypothetical protein n=1 Tax=Clostridium tarantellae TaxID=39493 RepID=UPI001478E383|nr:hypothetical protein [Clostridium tarantellae]